MEVAPKVLTMTSEYTSGVGGCFRKGLSQRKGALLMDIDEPSFSSKQVGMVDMIFSTMESSPQAISTSCLGTCSVIPVERGEPRTKRDALYTPIPRRLIAYNEPGIIISLSNDPATSASSCLGLAQLRGQPERENHISSMSILMGYVGRTVFSMLCVVHVR